MIATVEIPNARGNIQVGQHLHVVGTALVTAVNAEVIDVGSVERAGTIADLLLGEQTVTVIVELQISA